MTTTGTARQTVSDVDTNMMGIRSKRLYNLLKKIVDTGDCSALNENDAEEVLGEIIERITVSIPEDAFRVMGAEERERLKYRLVEIREYLRKKFQAKVFELEKFVNAISACCFVETSWKLFEDLPGERAARAVINGDSDQEDVSLTKIPWIDEETEKELVPFIKEIDSVMSVNFGFEDDDEEDENMGVEMGQFGGSEGDFVIEEYYEKDTGDGDDDDDDDDDYVEDAQSDTEEDDQEGDSEDDDMDDTRSNSQRKRKTMELDDFEYIEKSARRSKLTTPKKIKPKSRDALIGSPECSGLSDDPDSLSSSQEEERPEGQSQVSSLDQDVSFLISPGNKNSNNTCEEGKIRAVTDAQYERDLGSPLSNRAR